MARRYYTAGYAMRAKDIIITPAHEDARLYYAYRREICYDKEGDTARCAMMSCY